MQLTAAPHHKAFSFWYLLIIHPIDQISSKRRLNVSPNENHY